jgi:hypothetical protein
VLNPISPCILNILIDGKSLLWNLVAEAKDVIGSQSRQEPAGIKHNRYASASSTRLAMRMLCFPHCGESGTRAAHGQLIAADDENVTSRGGVSRRMTAANATNPFAGKSLLIFRNRIKPSNQKESKYFA